MKRLRRWRRNCLVVLVLLTLLCLGMCLALAFLVGSAEAQMDERPLDILLLIDHSDSMWDRDGVGSDPDLLRVQAAELLMAYLGTAEVSTDHRLGVIHFGGEAELVVPLTPLDDLGQETIRTAIVDPHRMGWTDPLAALGLAYETLFPRGQRNPARQPAVILLTDGKPELGRSASETMDVYLDDLRSLADGFHEQECPILTVAFSNEAIAPDPAIETLYRNLWQEIAARTPPASYHEAVAAADLLPVCHDVVARLSGAKVCAPIIETTVNGKLTGTVDVDAGLARVTLVVLHEDPALTMDLRRPGGAQARPSDPDVHRAAKPEVGLSVWSIENPRPGRWVLALRGQGAALTWRDVEDAARRRPEAYRIEVGDVPARMAGDEAIVIDASVREAKSSTEPLADPTLRIVVEVRRAGFAETTHLAHDDGKDCDATPNDGRHCLALSDLPPGASTLLLRALLDGDEVARRELAFIVEPPPTPTPSPDSTPSLTPSSTVAPSAGRHAERHVLGPLLVVVLIALASAGTGGWLLRRRRRRPSLRGRLRVLAAPSGKQIRHVIDLPTQPSAIVGPSGRGSLPLPGTTAAFKLRAVPNPEGDVETWIAPLDDYDDAAMTLNDRPLHLARRLRDGDVLALGAYRLRYEDLRQASLRRARHRPQRRVLTR